MVGPTLASLDDHSVTFTDSESALWPLIRKSIEANSIDRKKIWMHMLDWRDPSTFLLNHEYDLIVASDVRYCGMNTVFARALASHLPLGCPALMAKVRTEPRAFRG